MVIKHDFWYSPSSAYRRLHIWLPDDYAEAGGRYPVMYFFDGHNLFFDEDATFGKSWGFVEFLRQWGKKIIIVGIECGHGPDERTKEYVPYRWKGIEGNADATLQWIVKELKPYIDREYRTWRHREATGIAGSSFGGLTALYGLVRYNAVFSKGACVSTSLGFCQPQVMREMNNATIHPDTRAFLSWGTKEAPGVKDINAIDSSSGTYRRNKAISNKFEKAGAVSQLWCQVGGGHCEADWEKLIPGFMDFLWMR